MGRPDRRHAGRCEFADGDLKATYDDVVATGSASLADEAAVGITIERTNIADLTDVGDTTDAADVARIHIALRDGSERHRAAFERLAGRAT